MKNIINWSVKNLTGINVLLVILVVAGLYSFLSMRRETFPEFQLDVILVTVPYPGATPDEVESGICQKVEESIQSISGIKRITSICREGGGYTLAELKTGVDAQKTLSEIRSAVDRISVFFPERSEKSTVEQITFRTPAIRVAIIGPDDDSPETMSKLRDYAENIRERLIELKPVSQAELLNTKPYQIDVEIDEDTLRKYGLTLSSIANLLRRENVELPSGQLKSDGQEILLRGKNKREIGEEIAKLPVLTRPNGVVLTVGDIGKVRDEFDDISAVNEVNGKTAIVIEVSRTSSEDLLEISDAVHAFVKSVTPPRGFEIKAWGDESIDVRDRIRLLRGNGIQGGLIVFLILAIFLEFRLAFWVAFGIPICILGAGLVLFAFGETLNMLSMFAFLMAVGIIVDDAIVVGENIYAHRAMNKSLFQAAVDGTSEVIGSVYSSIATTIIAFIPLYNVSGVMGKFIAVMPTAIIAMLLLSLLECTFALPGHLCHESKTPRSMAQRLARGWSNLIDMIEFPFTWLGRYATRFMAWLGSAIYPKVLRVVLDYPTVPISVGASAILLAAGFIRSGLVPFEFFPETDGKTIIGQVIFPDGTPEAITADAARRMEAAIKRVSERIAEEEDAKGINRTPEPDSPTSPRGPVKLTFLQVGAATTGNPGAGERISGSHVGQIIVEIHDATLRNRTSTEIINMWREEAGVFPGAERVTYRAANIGPGGKPLEFKILAPRNNEKDLQVAVLAAKEALSKFGGVYNIQDDNGAGKIEFQFAVKESAKPLGITVLDLAETVRNAYYGAEVMRLQRGRNEVKLMVRYPIEQRRSLADLQEIRVRGSDNVERPITEVADITIARGYSEINRVNQMRSVTVTADLDTAIANAEMVARELKAELVPALLEQYPSLRFSWEGQQKETAESFSSLLVGFTLAMACMYLLLVFQFNSYLQPFIVLMIVPLGIVGAIFGHAIQGLPITLFSLFGMVPLAGVVVNDSIVLLDFINQRVRSGMPVTEALMTSGARRLRPIFLTSVTTIAGLLPMLLEKSFQAQVLIPMANALAFGLMASTLLVLFVVPFLYKYYALFAFTKEQFEGDWSEVDVQVDHSKPSDSCPAPALAMNSSS
jgi:multidrug efflux pump subunit AcrB